MNREQAKQALSEGKKVTHKSMLTDKKYWVPLGDGFIFILGGQKFDEAEYLKWEWYYNKPYNIEEYKDGWSIYEEPKQETQEDLWEEVINIFPSILEATSLNECIIKIKLLRKFTITRK